MSDNNLGDRSGIPGRNVETDVSGGQAALRRIMERDSHPDHSLTPEGSGKSHTKKGSVSARNVSPVQNFRLQKSTVETFGSRPMSSDFGGDDHESLFYGEKTHETQWVGDEMVRNAKVHEDSDVESRAERSHFRESQPAYDRALGGDRSVYLPGDFRYLTSVRPHIQVELGGTGSPKSRTSSASLIHQVDEQNCFSSMPENAGGSRGTTNYQPQTSEAELRAGLIDGEFSGGHGTLPERFHTGRESLSVRRNITVRESKRPKARILDREYQRRSSITPARMPSQTHAPQRLRLSIGTRYGIPRTFSPH
jgi:hypothetical protein